VLGGERRNRLPNTQARDAAAATVRRASCDAFLEAGIFIEPGRSAILACPIGVPVDDVTHLVPVRENEDRDQQCLDVKLVFAVSLPMPRPGARTAQCLSQSDEIVWPEVCLWLRNRQRPANRLNLKN
jgi:hypothetical protein